MINWTMLSEVKQNENNPSNCYIKFPKAGDYKWLRINICKKNDIDGKSFPAISNLIVYGIPESKNKRQWVKKPASYRKEFTNDIFIKYGLMKSNLTQLEQFNK